MPSRNLWDNQRASTVLSGYERIPYSKTRKILCILWKSLVPASYSVSSKWTCLARPSWQPCILALFVQACIQLLRWSALCHRPAALWTHPCWHNQGWGREYFRHCNFTTSKPLVNTSLINVSRTAFRLELGKYYRIYGHRVVQDSSPWWMDIRILATTWWSSASQQNFFETGLVSLVSLQVLDSVEEFDSDRQTESRLNFHQGRQGYGGQVRFGSQLLRMRQ